MIRNKQDLILTRAWVKEFDKQIDNRAQLKTTIEISNTKNMVRHRDSLKREIVDYGSKG